MKDLASQPVELAGDQQRFLQEMADKHGLPDLGKAIRCLVNYARDNPDRVGGEQMALIGMIVGGVIGTLYLLFFVAYIAMIVFAIGFSAIK